MVEAQGSCERMGGYMRELKREHLENDFRAMGFGMELAATMDMVEK
ncbi:hypothetical protein MtrunA17_Chr8g0379661 [Medicago truncatula]|uniref:Uncharacterized protein n=1 Tax=Medicago truncatula TaxID=3880 RepID=A0A396GQ81_MEDTR|nr:hypothetical protein MtrunA17_Chr8g0379661 [Medicago truncatula]